MLTVNTREFATSIVSSTLSYGTYSSAELKANAGERVLVHYELTLTVTSELFTDEQFDFTTAGQCTRLIGDFIGDGFAIGDTFKYYDSLAVYQFTGLITGLSNSVIQYTVSAGAAPTTVITSTGAKFRFNGTPNGLLFKFGLPYNSEADGFLHRLTGLEQAYIVSLGGPAVGSWQTAYPTDPNFETGSMRVRATTATDEFTTHYEIEHTFVMPAYADEYETNIALDSVPTGFTGSNAVRYVAYIELRATIGQLNSNKGYTDNLLGGGARWFDQNVNFQATKYSILSVDYLSTAAVTGIEPKESTHVTVTVECTDTIIATSTLFFISHQVAKKPTFTATSQSCNTRVAYDYFGGALTATGDGANSIINNVVCTVINTAKFTIEFDIENIDTTLLAVGDYFMLTIGAGEPSLDYDATDKQTMYVYGEYVFNSDVEGLITFGDFRLYNYKQPYSQDSATVGANDTVKVWNQDEMQLEFEFTSTLTGTTADPAISFIEFSILAYNATTGESFTFPNSVYRFPIDVVRVLEESTYSVDYATCSDRRSYNENTASDFKRATIETTYNYLLMPTEVNYTGFVGFKVDWQTWLQNADADTIFYDSGEPFNNLNNKISNYSELNGYRIHSAIKVGVSTYDATMNTYTLTEYLNRSVPMIVCDWDDDRETPDHWTQTIQTMNEAATVDYGGLILSDGYTLMRTTWTRYAATAILEADIYAAHRIEPSNYPTADFLERYGNNGENVSNIFAPVSGETDLKVTKVSTTVVRTECLIDGSKLQKGQKYNLSARLFAD